MNVRCTHAPRKIGWLLLSAALLSAQSASNDLTDATVRYVSVAGKDTNDGTSWTKAKATVAAAVNSLPRTTGSAGIHFGTVYVGPGRFVEGATPIEFNAEFHLVCASSTDGGFGQGS